MGRNAIVLSDDGTRLGDRDRLSGRVAQLIGFACAQRLMDTVDEPARDGAERLLVMMPPEHHHPVVNRRQVRGDPAGLLKSSAEWRRTGL